MCSTARALLKSVASVQSVVKARIDPTTKVRYDLTPKSLHISRIGVAELMKVPSHVLFRKDHSLILWKPRGILNEAIVNEIVAFIETAEKNCKKPFNRFSDLSGLDAVDLNFKFVFEVGLTRRLTYGSNPPVRSAFYVTSPATTHYAKLHKLLTDRSPLGVRLFTDRDKAANWLGVGPEVLVHRE